jgi:hypothetical protein
LKKYFNLKFNTDLNNIATIKVIKANESLESSKIKDTMQKMIDLDVFNLLAGKLINIYKADLITTEETNLTVK